MSPSCLTIRGILPASRRATEELFIKFQSFRLIEDREITIRAFIARVLDGGFACGEQANPTTGGFADHPPTRGIDAQQEVWSDRRGQLAGKVDASDKMRRHDTTSSIRVRCQEGMLACI